MEEIREAKKKGIKFGRSKKEIPKEFDDVAKQWRKNNILKKLKVLLKEFIK